MGIDGNKGADFLTRAKDDGNKPAHDLSKKYGNEFTQACEPWTEPTWKSGKVSSGGKWHKWNNGPPRGDFGTKDVAAASPSGKYAKQGGSGQRSGS